MKRSQELKKFLAESLDTESITSYAKTSLESSYFEKERKDQLRAQMSQAQPQIERLEVKLAQFKAMHPEISDEEFETQFQEIETAIRHLTKEISRYSDAESRYEERFCCVDFVSREEVTGFQDFIDKWAMQWMPTKKEIARLLRIAVQAHMERIAKGEKNKDEPIQIIDIGGANGFLAKLIVDLAEENNIPVKISIIDPDKETVSKAKEHYKKAPNMAFHNMDSGEWNLETYKDNPEVYKLLRLREEKIAYWNQKLSDLAFLEKAVSNRINSDLFEFEDFQNLIKVLMEDYGVKIPEQYQISTDQDFYEIDLNELHNEFYIDKYRWEEKEPSIKEKIFEKMNNEIGGITNQIEELLLNEPAKYDLAINSWMTLRLDYTRDVRAANAAAIAYMAETWGATGTQIHAGNPEYPSRAGESNSYETGRMYQMDAAWVGPSVPELSSKSGGYRRNENACNSVLIQTKKGYPVHLKFDEQSAAAGGPQVKEGKKYPWEEKMKTFLNSNSTVLRFHPGDTEYNVMFGRCVSASIKDY